MLTLGATVDNDANKSSTTQLFDVTTMQWGVDNASLLLDAKGWPKSIASEGASSLLLERLIDDVVRGF